MKMTKLSMIVVLGIFFIVTTPIHSHFKCKVKAFGTTNEACPHIHKPPEATSNHYMLPKSTKQTRLEKEKRDLAKRHKEYNKQIKLKKQADARRAQKARKAQEEERMYQEHKAYERKQENKRISRVQRRQDQDALRIIDRGRNYIPQPTNNSEIMRAEDDFARALRNVRGQ